MTGANAFSGPDPLEQPQLLQVGAQEAPVVGGRIRRPGGAQFHQALGHVRLHQRLGELGVQAVGVQQHHVGRAAAQHLAKHRNFDGIVYVIFQPAEEGGGGAREMIKDGLFKEFPMQAVFGMHNWPGPKVGCFAISPGPVMASSNEFKITIHGKGSHAALPHNGIDPVPIAAQLVQAFQTIISRNKKPVDAGVISVTMIHAGEATNVVPDTCELQGTVRTFTLELLDIIEKRMQEVAEHTCAAHGATCDFTFHRNYPPTINHPAETEFTRRVLEEMVGKDNVMEYEPTMGSEDFSFFLQEKPGCYFHIGNGDGSHREGGHGLGPCMLHNASYDFNDELIPLGGTFWVKLVEAKLGI